MYSKIELSDSLERSSVVLLIKVRDDFGEIMKYDPYVLIKNVLLAKA